MNAPVKAPPPSPPQFPSEAETLERQISRQTLYAGLTLIAGYAEIAQRNFDVWDDVGALQAFDKMVAKTRECVALRKKI
jgi:hypothetical protein